MYLGFDIACAACQYCNSRACTEKPIGQYVYECPNTGESCVIDSDEYQWRTFESFLIREVRIGRYGRGASQSGLREVGRALRAGATPATS
jgi:hypothetical protein